MHQARSHPVNFVVLPPYLTSLLPHCHHLLRRLFLLFLHHAESLRLSLTTTARFYFSFASYGSRVDRQYALQRRLL